VFNVLIDHFSNMKLRIKKNIGFFFTKIFRMFFFTTIHRPSLSLVNFPFMVPELCPHLLLYQGIAFVYEYLDLHV